MAYYASERSTGESWISGIQLHIGKSFIPPPKVTMPLRCDFGNPSDILFMEYDFSLEEHVVSWSENDRKQKELIAAEREARLQAREARLRASAACVEATHSDGENDDPATTTCGTTVVTNSQPSRNRNMNAAAQNSIPQFTPVSSAAATSQSLSGILTPTLVKPETKSKDKKHALSINLADFEREDDVFENVEMKTINDMEVLHTVLQTTVTLQNGQLPACMGNGVYASSGNHESCSTYQNNRGVPQQGFPQTTALPKIPTRQFVVQTQQHMPTLQGVNTVSSCMAPPINALSACRTQPLITSSPMSALPSCGTQPTNALSASRTQPLNTPSACRTQPAPNSFPHPQSQTFASPASQASVKMFSTGAVRYAAVSDGVSSASCALKGSLCTLSSSDISNDSLHRVMPTPPTYTPPPYPTRVQTPPLRPSHVQTQSLYQHPPKTTLRQVDLNNGTLGALINRVTNMGFHRHRVEKAIQILGEDDKQVIDYLCLQDRLMKKGFKMDDIEASLALMKNNEDEASHYLQLLNRFREFGFAEHKIKEALVSSELDEDKAIDCLTGM